MTMTNIPPGGAVYEITDAAPPGTPPPVAPLRVRLLFRAVPTMAVLLVVRLLFADAPWWVYAATCGWTVWPWLAPRLRRTAAVALLMLGALDALVTAYIGTPRLAYIARRIVEFVRDTAREENP
ncbi:hypothetical protein ACWDA3_51240 [Nonomuraea rubra]